MADNIIQQVDNSTFLIDHDLGKTTIGGSGDSFVPSITLDKWSDNSSLTVWWSQGSTLGNWETETNGQNNITKLTWIGDAVDVQFYTKPQDRQVTWQYTDSEGQKTKTTTQDSEGGVEYAIKLKQHPGGSLIQLPFSSQNLSFEHQGELHPDHPTWSSDETFPDGVANTFRPPNVVNSYAIYHADEIDGYAPVSAERQTGKAFHLYRPLVWDAEGSSVYADLNVNAVNSFIEISIPISFLDSATYPVIVDPTFGHDSVGASRSYISGSNTYGFYPFNPGESGSADSVSVWLDGRSSISLLQHGIYVNSDDSFNAETKQSDAGSVSGSFVTRSINNGGSLSNTDYILVTYQEGGYPDYTYDEVSGFNAAKVSGNKIGDSTINWDSKPYLSTRKYSAFVDYTTSGSPPSAPTGLTATEQ